MTQHSNHRRTLEAQVEQWIAEAKRLSDAGNEAAALNLYQRAADELPGAPWLQNRTAELARKLKKNDTTIHYLRRAATAFQVAGFIKRALPPLRTAWALALEALPSTSKPLVDVAIDLMQLQERLGLATDALVTLERTNAALRSRGFSELASRAPHPVKTEGGAAPAVRPRPMALVATRSDPPSGPRPSVQRSSPPNLARATAEEASATEDDSSGLQDAPQLVGRG